MINRPFYHTYNYRHVSSLLGYFEGWLQGSSIHSSFRKSLRRMRNIFHVSNNIVSIFKFFRSNKSFYETSGVYILQSLLLWLGGGGLVPGKKRKMRQWVTKWERRKKGTGNRRRKKRKGKGGEWFFLLLYGTLLLIIVY